MRVIFKEPGKEAEVRNIDNELDTLQSLVGGYIEPVTLSDRLVLIVDEEGKLKGKENNFPVPALNDMIVGNAIFVGVDENGEDFADINDNDAMIVMKFLRWQANGIFDNL